MKRLLVIFIALSFSFQSLKAQSTTNDAFTPVNDAFTPVSKPFTKVAKPFKKVDKPFTPVAKPISTVVDPYKQVADPYKTVIDPYKSVEFTHAVELGKVVELGRPVNGWSTPVDLGHAVELGRPIVDWSTSVELGNPTIDWSKAVELGRSVELGRPVELGQVVELGKIVELSHAVELGTPVNPNMLDGNSPTLPNGFAENITRGLQTFDYLKKEVAKSLQFFTGNFDETHKMWEDKYVQSYKDGHPNGFYLYETVASSLFTTKNAPTTLSALMLAPGLFEVAGVKIASTISDGDAIKLVSDGSKIVEKEGATQLSVRAKLTNYLLSTSHEAGATKAQWFEQALGFTNDNSEELAKQLVFDANKAVEAGITQFGTKYNLITSVKGANGQVADVMTVWIRNNDNIIRLVTAYPAR